MGHRRIVLTLVFAVPTLFALACSLGGAAAPAQETSVPSTDPAPAPPEERYVNGEGGFSLMLPQGWSVLGPLGMTVPESGAG